METNTLQHNKKEIIQLLLADMRNRKLLLSLEKAGLSSEDFYTGLCYIILSKMGFDGKKTKPFTFGTKQPWNQSCNRILLISGKSSGIWRVEYIRC